MRRGEIYFIQRRSTVGAEIAKARPAVIVSNNALNATSEVVEVVYLTTAPKKDLPTHVTIKSTGVTSSALCEQIDHVSKTLIDNWLGVCSADEMQAIDHALLLSLGLGEQAEHGERERKSAEIAQLTAELVQAQAERDRYEKIVDRLLETRSFT